MSIYFSDEFDEEKYQKFLSDLADIEADWDKEDGDFNAEEAMEGLIVGFWTECGEFPPKLLGVWRKFFDQRAETIEGVFYRGTDHPEFLQLKVGDVMSMKDRDFLRGRRNARMTFRKRCPMQLRQPLVLPSKTV